MREYAVYKGETLRTIGTAEECAKELKVTPQYIRWLITPTGKRRLASRERPENCTVAVVLDDGDKDE